LGDSKKKARDGISQGGTEKYPRTVYLKVLKKKWKIKERHKGACRIKKGWVGYFLVEGWVVEVVYFFVGTKIRP
jgi:hypothetical protein